MANRERGEVEVVVNEKPYTLRLTTNGICELQTRTKKTYGQLINDIVSMDYVSLREVVWQALKPNHAKEFDAATKAGTWIDDAGGVSRMSTVITDLLTINSQPKSEGDENPPNAQTDGTGEPSTEPLAASV